MTAAPFDETGPGGGHPEGGLGPVFLTLRGGHAEEYQRLAYLQNNGFVRDTDNPSVENQRYQWLYLGNAGWAVDERWSISEIERHHEVYKANNEFLRGNHEPYERLMADLDRGTWS